MKIRPLKKKHVVKAAYTFFWLTFGIGLGLFLFISFSFIIFQKINENVVYPGIMVDDINLSGKTEKETHDFFERKNEKISETEFVFTSDFGNVSITAGKLDLGYNSKLLAKQALSLGRSKDLFSNMSLLLSAYTKQLILQPSYRYSEDKLINTLSPIVKSVQIDPVDALFTFQNGRVTAFRVSSDGQTVDVEGIKAILSFKLPAIVALQKPQKIVIPIPIKLLKPKATTEKANNLGIKELIGEGTSLFQHSISERIYNIALAATRLNRILVEPGETFSFNQVLGDISAFTGYQKAYVIQNGKTVLGDGGGVCQVSTTLFRALLNAGLPIVERHAHAYRVGYYEQDSPPGFDATVYSPTIDLKFKNDTGNYILIQTELDPSEQRLTFSLYGTKDGRRVLIGKPVITNETPPPATLYQDDPTLPKGALKQTDFAAWGASVYFTREVSKNNQIIIKDKFVSNFQPWQAIYLRGTRE